MPPSSSISFTLLTSNTVYSKCLRNGYEPFPPTYPLCLKIKKKNFFLTKSQPNLEIGYFHPTCKLRLSSLEAVPTFFFFLIRGIFYVLQTHHRHSRL